MSKDLFSAHLYQTSWGIIDGAAATVGVRFRRDRPFGDPRVRHSPRTRLIPLARDGAAPPVSALSI